MIALFILGIFAIFAIFLFESGNKESDSTKKDKSEKVYDRNQKWELTVKWSKFDEETGKYKNSYTEKHQEIASSKSMAKERYISKNLRSRAYEEILDEVVHVEHKGQTRPPSKTPSTTSQKERRAGKPFPRTAPSR